MRPLLLFALLALAACDSSEPDSIPYAGIIEVSLAPEVEGGQTALRLVAVETLSCNGRLRVETAASRDRLDVRVVGVLQDSDGPCLLAVSAEALVPLPFTEQGSFPVSVAHRGSTDAYAYSIGFAGERLDAVRTSTTRLATP